MPHAIGKRVRQGSTETFSHTPPIREYGLGAESSDIISGGGGNNTLIGNAGNAAAFQTSAAQAAPAGQPNSVPSGQPRPSAQIIDFEDWKRNNRPQQPRQSPKPWRWWRLTPVGVFLTTLLTPTQLADGTLPLWEHYAPTDSFEAELQNRARQNYNNGEDRYEIEQWYAEQLQSHKEQLAQDEAENTEPVVIVEPGVSIRREEDEEEKPCRTGRYGSLKCPGQQAHHIVPDYTLRYGTRAEGISGLKRIPGLPSFRDGPAICLSGQAKVKGDAHFIAHKADERIAVLGGAVGAAPIAEITSEGIAGAIEAAPNCIDEIYAEVAKQPSLSSTILGRTTINPPGTWPPN